jgi:hypothetical protein
MEYMSRDNRTGAPAAAPHGRRKHIDWAGRAVRIEWFVFTALVALVLLLAIGWLIFSGNGTGTESKQIDNSKYQAVFLNGGATSGSVAYTTYFGHVTKLNNNYMILKDVYYLTTSTTNDNSQAANPQLTKLGCQQLHSPQDEMVINRSQVAFWENLQDSGKVVQAIKQFKAQNPNGPNCSSTSNTTNSTNQSSTSTQQSTTPTTNKTNP